MVKIIRLSIIILFLLAISISTISAFAGGDGTIDSPYQISTWNDLNQTKLHLSDAYYYILINNLSSSTTDYNGIGNAWFPIGKMMDGFTGSFDGNNYVISDLIINLSTTDYVGLFGIMLGDIANIGLVNISVLGNNEVGGLIGEGGGRIANCYIIGDITGANYVGGIMGKQVIGTILNSYSMGNVISSGNYVGGLVGYQDQSDGSIYNSYSTVDINTGSFSSYVGGLVGVVKANVSNSYSIGEVNGNNYVGGLIGLVDGGIVLNSYYDINHSGQADIGKGEPRTIIEMKQVATFNNWDMQLSQININDGNPYLGWMANNNSHIWFIYQRGVIPNATNFSITEGSTDFSIIDDMNAIPNLILATIDGKIDWNGITNVSNQDLNTNIQIGYNFVSINSSNLDATLNSSANISLTGINCANFIIYYSFGTYGEDLFAQKTICPYNICTNVICSGNKITFTVSHFSGYIVEENPISSTNNVGSGGGSGNGICPMNYTCSAWSTCGLNGTQIRTCNKVAPLTCSSGTKPIESQSCIVKDERILTTDIELVDAAETNTESDNNSKGVDGTPTIVIVLAGIITLVIMYFVFDWVTIRESKKIRPKISPVTIKKK